MLVDITSMIIKFLTKVRIYWMRGYSTIAIFISLFNFNILLYNFILKKSIWLPSRFNNFWICFLIIFLIMFPLVIFLGKKDFHKGTWQQEQIILSNISPIWKKVFGQLDRIENNNKKG